MNELLTARTMEMSPAHIAFNFIELSNVLDVQLKHYEGLEFNDETASDCKKTISELNAAKKSLDDYRKKVKQELTAPVTAFEKQCKELTEKFNTVISPLKNQYDDFEVNRQNQKIKLIQPLIDELVKSEGLDSKHVELLSIEPEYLNKSKSIKSIAEDLKKRAEAIGMLQDKVDSELQMITDYIELTNLKFQTNLTATAYKNLIGHKSIVEIKNIISSDAAAESKNNVAVVLTGEKVTDRYVVVGTESQLDALEEYMSSHAIEWNVIES